MKVGKHLTGYDTCDIIDNHVRFTLEENNKEGLTEDEIRDNACHDSFLFEDEFEYITEYLTEIMQQKNQGGYWKATMNNFGWRNLDGCKFLYADIGKNLLQEILPDCDCTFKIYNYGKGIAIQNWHHDSPVENEWYYITPCVYSTYERNC